MNTAMTRPAWGLIAVGAAACVAADAVNRALFFPSLFYAFILWLSMSLGALAFLMTHHLTGGRWGFMVRRILEAAVVPLPLLAVLFFIFFLGSPALRQGHGYFEPGWIAFRSALNFGIWIGLAWALRRRSLLQDRSEDPRPTRKMRMISGPGLVLYFLSVSFAMTDWLMELVPGWRSTMFPGIMMSTQALMALSGAVAVFLLLPKTGEAEAMATSQAWHDLGKLLFAFVIFWAYVAFSQLLVIWSGNLPQETLWYRQRSVGGWQGLAMAVGAFCFFAPAAVLLFQGPKHAPRVLAMVAAGIWVSQAVFLFWVVTPSFYPAFHWSWTDVLVPAAVGVIWAAFFWHGWRSALPVPRNDPRLEQPEVAIS